MIWSILGIFLCIVLDQATKYLATTYLAPAGTMPFIPGVMELRYVLNDGAAFSSFSGATTFLLIFTGVALAALTVYLFWKKPARRMECAALVLLIGGGLGNFIDRLRTGVVVDFFATTFMDFAVFNVADCFVCIGVGLLILSVFLEEWKAKKVRVQTSKDDEAGNAEN